MGDMLLRDYKPQSMLCVKETEVPMPKFPVFEAHGHVGKLQMDGEALFGDPENIDEVVRQIKSAGVVGVINLKMFWGKPLKEHLKSLEKHAGFIHTFAGVDVTRLEESGFPEHVDSLLKEYKSMGVCGLKLWKNLGCTFKDSSGKYILPDDDRLRPIWEAAAKYKLAVLYHIADPKSFFTPVDEKNESYLTLVNNPSWIFYGEGRYSFEELMESQDRLLGKNPDTTFVIPHVGSYGENLGWVGAQLDAHPNMYIDTAARINHLGRQPYTAREFFIKYADRILFGTDISFDIKSPVDFYKRHWRFFETYDEYINIGGRWHIYGLGLPDDVLKKFYFENAQKLFKSVGINI